MILNISKGAIPQHIKLPPSKSYANRALILGAQKKTKTIFKNLPQASDVTNLVEALKAAGLLIELQGETLTFQNSFPSCEIANAEVCEIEVGEGGTTARFLACLLLRGANPYILKLGERLKDRPWNEFLEFAEAHGANCRLEDDKLFLQGPLRLGPSVEVDCSRTTQFATGLALCFKNSKIIPTKLHTSQSYWEMTLKLIEDFDEQEEYITPIDWSSAGYSLAFAALNQETFFPHLKSDIYQADSKFYDLLKSLGMLTQSRQGVLITPKKVSKNITLDVSDCLDLVPTLVYFLSYIPGEHQLIGVENLVHKESDRLFESIRIMKAFDISSVVTGNTLKIRGSENRFSQRVDLTLPDDHRMVMSAALFMRHNAGGSISPWQAVNKSYPDFFNLFD